MYIDAFHDKQTDKIKFVHRENKQRLYREYSAPYEFYYEHPDGKHKGVDGKNLKIYSTNSRKKFQSELSSINGQIYESDINPIFKVIEKNYHADDLPELNIGFFDIEVNYSQERGYSTPMDPFNEINAISLYRAWEDKLITFVVGPRELTADQAYAITKKFSNCILCENERDLLEQFLSSIEDVDLLSGWNSQFFDLPYIIRRIEIALSRDYTRQLCLWNQLPKKGSVLRFKKEHLVYSLVGRIHLDYLDLYRKHTPSVKHTYKLDYIGEIEVGENKIPYDGTLDTLYRYDFEKFIAYNRQDTELIAKIDKSLKYINLSNLLVHANGVLFKNILGSVAMIDQAIIREAHERNLYIPNRKTTYEEDLEAHLSEDDEEDTDNKVAGAYVQKPKIGFHRWIGGLDINSLYPSAIRALNIAPEALFGQIRPLLTDAYIKELMETNSKYTYADAWAHLFSTLEYEEIINRSDKLLVVDFFDAKIPEGKAVELTARQIYDIVFAPSSNLIISANGTIFRRDIEGVLPGLLTKWFNGRREMQGLAKKYAAMSIGIELSEELLLVLKDKIPNNRFKNEKHEPIEHEPIEYDPKILKELIENANNLNHLNHLDHLDKLIQYIVDHDLILDNNILLSSHEKYFKDQYEHWDRRQYLRKILLNSAYGALLNQYSRFFDQRLGQSVTLTGRCIVRHMGSFVNEQFDGTYEIGNTNIYGDTDSAHCHSIINAMTVNKVKMTIEELFDSCSIKWRDRDKEYAVDDKIKILSYDAETQESKYYPINYVYRHKVSKARYRIHDSLGNHIDVTEDHAIVIERDGKLLEVMPNCIQENDLLISVVVD